MSDRRCKNVNWLVADESGALYSAMRDGVTVALLMDIRDELQRLNNLLHCPNFVGIPKTLRSIQRNTTKRKRATKKR